MDIKLKEAIETVRSGDKETAQRQLTTLLEENPAEAQGWYLLSLLVDSPQKQAAYLSKTLALNPNHAKAQKQLATLQQDGKIAPTTTIRKADSEPMGILSQAESDDLPNWLQADEDLDELQLVEQGEDEEMVETAVANETLPDWLKEPIAPSFDDEDEFSIVQEELTAVAQPSKSTDERAEAIDTPSQTKQPAAKTPAIKKSKPAAKSSTTSLNIILTILVLLAFVVMIMLAYLIFS